MSVRVHLLGTGNAFGHGGRMQTCFVLEDGQGVGGQMMIDCGASSLIALRQAGMDPLAIDGVLLSHMHGDHFAGLPYLMMDFKSWTRRTRDLAVAGPQGFVPRLAETADALFPDFWGEERPYATTFSELVPRAPVEVAGRRVTAQVMKHHSGPTPSLGFRIETAGKVIAFSGDTAWTDHLVDLAADADLLICECYHPRPMGKGHLDLETLRAEAPRLTARQIVLTHPGLMMLDAPDEGRFQFARDGMVVEV